MSDMQSWIYNFIQYRLETSVNVRDHQIHDDTYMCSPQHILLFACRCIQQNMNGSVTCSGMSR